MNREPYKVTIGIPLYNCESYIERCLNSILNQTYQNIEIIVVNDGSTDNSLNIVENIKNNNKGNKQLKIFSKENEGPSSTRNYIIEKATGKFILFIDSDDWIEKDAVEKMVKLQCENDCDVVRANYFINCNERKSINVKISRTYKNNLINISESKEKLISDILLGNINSFVWILFIKKDIITKDLFFENGYNYQEDKIFLIKLISNIKSIFFSADRLYHYYMNINSLTHKYDFNYYLKSNIEINRKISEIISQYYNNSEELLLINNSISLYSIERILYNIYKTAGKNKMLEVYNNIKECCQNISKKIDYNCLKKSKYAVKKDYFLKKWDKRLFF